MNDWITPNKDERFLAIKYRWLVIVLIVRTVGEEIVYFCTQSRRKN